jgi:hypothetical protein
MPALLAGRVSDAQLAASALLLAYLVLVAVLLPRELRFIAGVEGYWKRLFIFQDALITLCILLTLLPVMAVPQLQLAGFITLLTGFIGMWASALWAGVSRYVYTYRVLLGTQRDLWQSQLMQSNRTKDEHRE